MSLLLRSCSVLHCLGPYISPPDPHTQRGGGGRRKEKEKQLTSNFGFLSLLLQNGPRDRGEMNGEPGKGRIYAQRTYRDCRSYCRAGWRRAVAFVPPPTFVLVRVLGLKGRRTLNEESFYANTHTHCEEEEKGRLRLSESRLTFAPHPLSFSFTGIFCT